MWPEMNFEKKNFFLKLILISLKKLRFQSTFKAQLVFFLQKYGTTFSKQFGPNIFFMFSVLGSRIEHKKLLKTKQQCTFV